MKKIVLSLLPAILSLSTVASATQIIQMDQKNGNSPILQWRLDGVVDNIQFNPGNNVYLLITNDRETDGHKSCHINITGCQQNLLGLSAGDAAVCEPKQAVNGVQIHSTCTYEQDGYVEASGTYQFLTK